MRAPLELLLVIVAACDVGAVPLATGGGDGSGAPAVFPHTQIYTGFDATGATTYRVPIGIAHLTGVQWASQDPMVATVTGTDALGMVVGINAGLATIDVTAAADVVSIPLQVNAYAAADLAAGATAFTTTYACGGCHSGTAAADGPDVSASGIAQHTDAQLLAVITTGITPDGPPVSIGVAMHSFPVAAGSAESRGLPAYLRSLTPATPLPDQ